MVKAKQKLKKIVKKSVKTSISKKKVALKNSSISKESALVVSKPAFVINKLNMARKNIVLKKGMMNRNSMVPKLVGLKGRASSVRITKQKFKDLIIVLDFGSQYTQLIARRIRESKVYSKIVPYNISKDEVAALAPKGIIFSGGPLSVYDKNAPMPNKELFELGIPILGVCYGMQAICHMLGGKVSPSKEREFGRAELFIDSNLDLFANLSSNITCWMSHGDAIVQIPKGFMKLAHTLNASIAAFGHRQKKIYGVQFHPEVVHTQRGIQVINNFIFSVCGCFPRWTMDKFVDNAIKQIKEQVGNNKVVLGLSGGVDSSVAAMLIQRAIGSKLHCIFVDNGLLRKDEAVKVERTFKQNFKINLSCINAEKNFLKRLHGVEDPEQKRKIIGDEFVNVFVEKANKISHVKFLAQGTLYPDVIESTSPLGGPSDVIKTHHNVGGLPKNLKLELLEPFRELFKDEVRSIGKILGAPETVINRQPFPGPGLAIRILGEITKERLEILREADERVVEEVKKAGLYNEIWQSFAVLLPIKTVGVMGDQRTYENVIAVRCVSSVDGMTADWVQLPYDLLCRISNRIINEVKGVNRVVYDVSSKPPATIEWE